MGFSDLGRALSKLGQDTKNGVQKVSDSVSISNKISQEKKSLERLFALIGEAVYKENPDSPKEGLEDEWAAVKVAYANIASYTEQLNQVKGIVCCPNCGRPAASGDKFCAKCGFKLNIRPETTGAKMAKDLKEAGQEVGKIAGDAADKTGEAVGGAAAGTKNAFSWLKGRFKKTKETEQDTSEKETPKREDAPGREGVPERKDVPARDGAGSAGTAEEVPVTAEKGFAAGDIEDHRTEEASAEESGEAAEDAPFRGDDDAKDGEETIGVEESCEAGEEEAASQKTTVVEEALKADPEAVEEKP